MSQEKRELLEKLKFELAFVEEGGYGLWERELPRFVLRAGALFWMGVRGSSSAHFDILHSSRTGMGYRGSARSR